ncbi:MAG: TonB-dependent receptor, partial [Mediterranea sp.]|nr:TonB-dependent receptor [Mediterranea sp.]
MKKLFNLVLMLFLLAGAVPLSAEGQQKARIVSGKVTDAATKEPLPGANVWIKNTTSGVITDMDGNYHIKVSQPGTVLVFSFMGYDNLEKLVGSSNTLNIGLHASAEALKEVVVVGYGTQKKQSVVGAITAIKPTELLTPTAFASNALAGQVAGMQVIQRSGEPGTHADFWIRGLSTMNTGNATPLILVDGIERSLDNVDTEDIASISVLKDASATAIYGVRGANGVILVTTRAGKAGKPKIEANAYAGMIQPTKIPDFVNSAEFADYYNEVFAYTNPGKKFYSDEAIQRYRDHSDGALYPDVDWMNELFKDMTWSGRASVNVSGGGTMARYYVSSSYYTESSIFKTDPSKSYNSATNYNKFNFRANIDLDITKTTKVQVNLANCYESKTAPGGANIWRNAFEIAPNAMPLRLDDGTLTSLASLPLGYDNPYNSMTQYGYVNTFTNSTQTVAQLTQDLKFITPGLKFNAKFSWDTTHSSILSYTGTPNTYEVEGRDADGALILNQVQAGTNTLTYDRKVDDRTDRRTTYLEASFIYDHLFAKVHRVGAMFLYNQQSSRHMNDINKNNSVPYRHQGIAGRATYAYADKYLLEFNFGYNGSENFSPANRYGFFPSVDLGWRISEEKFWQPLKKAVNNFKIRGSYGLVGNDNIGGSRRFIYNPTYNTGAGVYIYGDGSNPGWIRAGDPANNNVTWETNKKLDLGVDLGLFNDLTIALDYYNERREGIFLQRNDITMAAGLNVMPWSNMGIVHNHGFEMHAEYQKQLNKDWSLSLRGTIDYNHNIIIKNADPPYNYPYRNREGRPVGQTFGLIAEGLFSSQEEIDNSPTQFGNVRVGDIKYRDLNGDGTITKFDETAIGFSWMPEVNYSGGFSLRYKQFDLSALFQGVARVSVMLGGSAFRPFSTGNRTISAFFQDVYDKAWKLDNQDPHAIYPRAYDGVNSNNS